MSRIEVVPNAGRMVRSLRDMGYEFTQAVADIIDNSIAARAKKVEIEIRFNGDESWVRIVDDGEGMTPAVLREAMRYGSARAYGRNDLGKFGLGLKTASMSQCQRLTVATRPGKNRARISGYSWDLDHIEKTNRWEILPLGNGADSKPAREPLKKSTGTVVLWQRLDRILGYKLPYGEFAKKKLATMCREVEEHLAMVFHRFLADDVRGKRLRIFVNGNKVIPWDPFCRAEEWTQRMDPITLPLEHEGIKSEITLEPYILPKETQFSSPEAFRSAGRKNWNQQQGFYIYRANRMIQSGGWSRLRTPDEHVKLARIALDFSTDLDEAFKINVAKMSTQLPSQIREDVKRHVAVIAKAAKNTYDTRTQPGSQTARGTNTKTDGKYGKSKAPKGGSADRAAGRGTGPLIEERLTISEWTNRLMAVAKRKERRILKAVLDRIQAK